jgi:hypothetical protein
MLPNEPRPSQAFQEAMISVCDWSDEETSRQKYYCGPAIIFFCGRSGLRRTYCIGIVEKRCTIAWCKKAPGAAIPIKITPTKLCCLLFERILFCTGKTVR